MFNNHHAQAVTIILLGVSVTDNIGIVKELRDIFGNIGNMFACLSREIILRTCKFRWNCVELREVLR